jgi:signal transduction histidine kinase
MQHQATLLERFWEIAGAASVRVKVLGIVLGVVLLLGAFVIFQLRLILGDTLLDSFVHQGEALAASTADNAVEFIAIEDMNALTLYLEERASHYSSDTHNTRIDYIAIMDETSAIIASAGMTDIPADKSIIATHRVPDTTWQVQIGLSRERIDQTVNEVTLQVFEITLIMVAVGFAAAFFLTYILTRPIRDLVNATHAVARGNLSRRVPRWANDEIGELATAFNQMTDALQTADAERAERDRLRENYISGVIVALENERSRIARELHDSTGQTLTSLLVGLQNLKASRTEDGNFESQVEELRGVVGVALDEVRAISWRLRPSALDDLGLVSALEHHFSDYHTRYGIPVDLVVRGLDQRLPPEMETAVYRMIQEGLTNIARYAKATSASVVIARRDDLLRIIVEDNGVGFDPAAIGAQRKSLGLQGIRERAGLFGGSLRIESQPGQGTSLFMEIPLKALTTP